MCENIREKLVITRKPHQCFYCLRDFAAKSELYRSTNTSDGEIYTVYTCKKCHEVVSLFDIYDFNDDGFPEGAVIESAYDGCYDFIPSKDDLTKDEILDEFYNHMVKK